MMKIPTSGDVAFHVHTLLERLAEWEKCAGVGNAARPGMKSTGEAVARIADLKAQLAAHGAVYHWDGERYVLDTPMSKIHPA